MFPFHLHFWKPFPIFLISWKHSRMHCWQCLTLCKDNASLYLNTIFHSSSDEKPTVVLRKYQPSIPSSKRADVSLTFCRRQSNGLPAPLWYFAVGNLKMDPYCPITCLCWEINVRYWKTMMFPWKFWALICTILRFLQDLLFDIEKFCTFALGLL